MSDFPLAGKKVAVLLETEYVPGEIKYYRDLFAARGVEVHLMSKLWGNSELVLVSDVDEFVNDPNKSFEENLQATRQKLEALRVNRDFTKVKPEDYAAVIMAANYTSVRLRWFDAPPGQAATAPMARTASAVDFFGRAMRDPKIVKGALCHGLWILTPTPELLSGRKVICNHVVVADVTNAGGLYVPPLADGEPVTAEHPAKAVVVDHDLVTGESWHDTPDFIAAIADLIVRFEREGPPAPVAPSASGAPGPWLPVPPGAGGGDGKKSPKSIIIVLSERGYWGEELVGPVEMFDAQGYKITFATPKGKRPRALPPSLDSRFIDPALGRPVVSEEMAEKSRQLDESKRLTNPVSLADWIPERPYWSDPTFVRKMEAYNWALDRVYQDIQRDYDAMLIVGGSGPIIDLVNNQRVHDLILGFYKLGRAIGAECYGVPCLAFARDVNDRKSIIWGKHVTGHCLEYDYKDGTGFLGDDVKDFNMGPPPYPLEYILRDATGPDGGYHGNFGKPSSVIVDYPFITGRSTPDAYLTGQMIIEVLEHDLRQWGWRGPAYASGPVAIPRPS